eukprot:2883439-Alexandrium_andersonii.AAC.1
MTRVDPGTHRDIICACKRLLGRSALKDSAPPALRRAPWTTQARRGEALKSGWACRDRSLWATIHAQAMRNQGLATHGHGEGRRMQ